MTGKRQILLGLFLLGTLSLLAYYTLFMTDFSLFKERIEVRVLFPEGGGLRPGDSVLIAGIRQGRVTSLAYDPKAPDDRRVSVELALDEPLELREGFSIAIEDSTLLGGKELAIDPGPAEGSAVDPALELFGEVHQSPLESLGELVSENRSAVSEAVQNVGSLTSDWRNLSADVRAGKGLAGRIFADEALAEDLASGLRDFSATMERAAAISADLREGKGTAGRLLNDEALSAKVVEIADGLKQVLDELRTLSGDLREGRGTLGYLLRDEKGAAEFAETVSSVREIAAKINSGEGSLGKLVNDRTIADNLESFTQSLREGKGTLSHLLTDDELYEKLTQIVDDVHAATSAMREGRGTLGKLVFEDDVYREIERALALVTRSLEEYREAAPVTTFTSVLFGAF